MIARKPFKGAVLNEVVRTRLVIDVEFVLGPHHIIPLNRAHSNERLERLFAVSERGVRRKRQTPQDKKKDAQ